MCKDSVDKEWLHCSSTWKMSPSPSHFRIQLKWFVFAHRQKKTNPKNKNKKMFPYLKQNSTSLTSKHLIPKKSFFRDIWFKKKKKELDAITLVHCKRQRPAFVFARNSREFQFQIFEENNKRLPSYCTHTHSKQTY